MFGLFKKKSEIDKLEDKYQELLKEAYNLSTSNRKLSDSKTAEAHQILKQIEDLQKNV
ncbi:MAG: Lacal_2735 family protein [Saprospiraceae bacterium]